MPEWVGSLEETSAQFREERQARRGLLVPDEDPDCEPLGEAFPGPARERFAPVLQAARG